VSSERLSEHAECRDVGGCGPDCPWCAYPEPPTTFPLNIAVFCDRCGVEVEHDYVVHDLMTREQRLAVARDHLTCNEGWSCTAAGDYCPEHNPDRAPAGTETDRAFAGGTLPDHVTELEPGAYLIEMPGHRRNGDRTVSTRAEHMKWCKDRALEYADQGDVGNTISSLMSDLAKHPETESSCRVVAELMGPLAMMGHLDHPGELRKFVEGFN
jgi:hypothetical protein